jgi:hypothetical protein
VVEHLPSIHEVPGSILTITKNKKNKHYALPHPHETMQKGDKIQVAFHGFSRYFLNSCHVSGTSACERHIDKRKEGSLPRGGKQTKTNPHKK